MTARPSLECEGARKFRRLGTVGGAFAARGGTTLPAWFDGAGHFGARLAVLLSLMATVAAVERWRRGPAANRWREYLFVVGVAAAGALAGVAIDACTSRISPAYFIEWKGIEAGEGFGGRAVALGAKAGFGAGFLVAALLAYAATRRASSTARSVSFARLSYRATRVLLAALTGAAALALLGWCVQLPPPMADPLFARAPDAIHAWWIHLGAYAGAAVGLGLEFVRRR